MKVIKKIKKLKIPILIGIIVISALVGIHWWEKSKETIINREKVNNGEIITIQKDNLTYKKIEYKPEGRKFKYRFYEDLRPALNWIQENLPKDAAITTWWDYGHSIRGYTDRKVIAYNPSKQAYKESTISGQKGKKWNVKESGEFTPHTLIKDLGKILSTNNSREAIRLMEKYNSNYILLTSSDIGKFRWFQYFGTGCDGTGQLTRGGQQKCPLYSPMPIKNQKQNKFIYKGGVVLDMSNQTILPKIQTQRGERIFENMLVYQGKNVTKVSYKNRDNTMPGTLWVHPEFDYVVYIPLQQEDSMFTQLFFEETKNLDSFTQIYKDNFAKIYKLTTKE